MNILRVRDTKILNFKSTRSLLSTFFVCAARALLCEWRLEVGGVGIYYFRSEPKYTIYWSTDFMSEQVERVHNHSTARWVMTIEVRLRKKLSMHS